MDIKIREQGKVNSDKLLMNSPDQNTLRRSTTALLFTLFTFLCFPAFIAAAPAIQHWTTDNGARVYFVPAPELPIVNIRILFDAGSARDGRLPGLAKFTNQLLDQGAAQLNADQIAEQLEDIGAELSTTSYRDMAVVDLRCLSETAILNSAISTAARIIGKPAFTAASVERVRQRLLMDLQARKQSPADIAEDAFFAALYTDHPYGTPSEGSETALQAITNRDISRFHQRYYVARNAVVAVVGDLSREKAEKAIDTLVASLAPGQAAAAIPPVPPRVAAQVVHIPFPSSQTHILMGQPALRRPDPDYYTLYVGNHVLGGSGLVSRISEEVREKRGLSYSAYSYFLPMRQPGPFMIGLQTRNDQVTTAMQVVNDTVRQFLHDGPSKRELKDSRQNITGGFPLRLSSNKKIVSTLAMIGFYQLPLDYLDHFTDKIKAVRRDQIRETFQRRLHPDTMVTVMVGGQQDTNDGEQ